MRTVFDFSAENAKIADCLAERSEFELAVPILEQPDDSCFVRRHSDEPLLVGLRKGRPGRSSSSFETITEGCRLEVPNRYRQFEFTSLRHRVLISRAGSRLLPPPRAQTGDWRPAARQRRGIRPCRACAAFDNRLDNSGCQKSKRHQLSHIASRDPIPLRDLANRLNAAVVAMRCPLHDHYRIPQDLQSLESDRTARALRLLSRQMSHAGAVPLARHRARSDRSMMGRPRNRPPKHRKTIGTYGCDKSLKNDSAEDARYCCAFFNTYTETYTLSHPMQIKPIK